MSDLVQNQIYVLKADPKTRLIFWYRSFDRYDGRTYFIFVVAPLAGEVVGKQKGAWIYPDEKRIRTIEVNQPYGDAQKIEDLVELVETLPHEIIKLIPHATDNSSKPNLP